MMRAKYFVLILTGLALLCSCKQEDKFIQLTGYAQGGTYSVKCNIAGVKVDPRVIQHDVDSLLMLVDNTLSGYNKGSLLSRYNAGLPLPGLDASSLSSPEGSSAVASLASSLTGGDASSREPQASSQSDDAASKAKAAGSEAKAEASGAPTFSQVPGGATEATGRANEAAARAKGGKAGGATEVADRAKGAADRAKETEAGSVEMLRDIYAKSYEYYKQTDGAFNVAAGPLFDIWGFGFTSDSLPQQSVIDEALLRCEMPAELPAPGTIRLNFNAIAQGYTCDVIAEYLHEIGVKDMLVDIGEIYCEGHNPSGKNWSVGVDSPFDGNNTPGQELRGILDASMAPQGIVTSGNYRKFYVRDGKKYAHTIDPRNGYPVQHNLLSATIIAKNATEADALATYCMVLGFKDAKAFIESRSDLEGYLIYDVNGVMSQWSSPGFMLRPDTIKAN